MSSAIQSAILQRLEPALQTIERRFGRTRRGALIQLGVVFIILGLLMSLVAPQFIPSDLRISRRGDGLPFATFCMWGGAAISLLGAYLAWIARGMTDGES